MTAAQEQLVLDHRHLVRTIAFRLLKTNGSNWIDDAISDGNLGLVQAALRYRPGAGSAPFDQFAWTRISGAILDGFRRREWRTRGAVRDGEEITLVSLEEPVGVERHLELHEIIPARGDDPCDVVAWRDDLRALAALPPREREVLVRSVLGDEPGAVIAADFGLTEGRVSQIAKSGRERLARSRTSDAA